MELSTLDSCRVCSKTLDISSPNDYCTISILFLSSEKQEFPGNCTANTQHTKRHVAGPLGEKNLELLNVPSTVDQVLCRKSVVVHHAMPVMNLKEIQSFVTRLWPGWWKGWKVKTVNSLRVDASSTKYRGGFLWFTHLQNFDIVHFWGFQLICLRSTQPAGSTGWRIYRSLLQLPPENHLHRRSPQLYMNSTIVRPFSFPR